MINLEQEFQLLMRTVIKQIDIKVSSGELTTEEATKLVDMVGRCHPKSQDEVEPEPSWESSFESCTIPGYPGWKREQDRLADACPEGHDYDCGWSSSMGYHC